MKVPNPAKISPLYILVVLVVLLVAAVPSYYFYDKYQQAQLLLKNPQAAAKKEIQSVVARVGRLMDLPTGEDPTLATVSDREKLKDQVFFAKAQNGDKVLIYPNAKKAILYRPSVDRIIEVAPVNLNANQTSGAQQQQGAKVVINNGTGVSGLANKMETQLKAKVSNLEIVSKGNAAKGGYKKTVVVDVSGTRKDLAAQIAQTVNGDVSDLPVGEAKPTADLLIIIG
ncbi:LytR C-terminal domain-containing protein, partial [Candidatus Curtissbacteria bacterium]|nr:LytR C-terminal domain-containing protein [Candidatus Curtissbacteria bacterium]